MTETLRTGGCQCGRIRYEVRGPLGRASICHCRMCQKALGNVAGPFVTAPGLVYVRGQPKRYRSSNKVQRGFCEHCGTPLTYEPDGHSAELAIGTLDDPRSVAPVIQIGIESRLPWFETLASLPTRSPREVAAVASFFEGVVSHQHPDRPTDDDAS